MPETRIEYSEQLWITTGVCGDDQESSFMNATLQHANGGLEFSVAVHVGLPPAVVTELELRDYLRSVFAEAIAHTNLVIGPGTLNVEIHLGPEGDGEEE